MITVITIFIESGIPCLLNDFKPFILIEKKPYNFLIYSIVILLFLYGLHNHYTVLKGNCLYFKYDQILDYESNASKYSIIKFVNSNTHI